MIIYNQKREREDKRMREKLLDRMIKIYGFEHDAVIVFAKLIESPMFTDAMLEAVVMAHEAHPVGFDEDEE